MTWRHMKRDMKQKEREKMRGKKSFGLHAGRKQPYANGNGGLGGGGEAKGAEEVAGVTQQETEQGMGRRPLLGKFQKTQRSAE